MSELFVIGHVTVILEEEQMVGMLLCTGKEIKIYRSNFIGELAVGNVIVKHEEHLGKFRTFPIP